MKSPIIGTELAKNVVAVYLGDEGGQGITRCRLSWTKLLPYLANRAPPLVEMEACGGASYCVREMEKLGHTARLIALQSVTPWMQTNTSDPVDARAIRRAIRR